MIRALIPLLLLPFLNSCADKPEVVYVDRVVKVYPPGAYLAKCHKPELTGNTWKAIGQLAIERGTALDDCADKMDSIISWSNKGAE